MIVAIADDLTGATEIGGVAWRYGLAVEVQTGSCTVTEVDAVVVDARTRACCGKVAAERVRRVAAQSLRHKTQWLYKKVDSVLRGRVLDELVALLDFCDLSKALLVAANPGLLRRVRQGQYWVGDRPLHDTDFANDPAYPAATSDVRQLLLERSEVAETKTWPVCTLRSGQTPPGRGIFIGDAASGEDIASWARTVDDETLPVGAAEFFAAWLEARGHVRVRSAEGLRTSLGVSSLFVSGSTSAYGRSWRQECEEQGVPVLRMPESVFAAGISDPGSIRSWAREVVNALAEHRCAVVAIDRPVRRDAAASRQLLGAVSACVEQALSDQAVDHVCVEGGETAKALVDRLGWFPMQVCAEVAPGVVTVQLTGRSSPLLTMKPGSYEWPTVVRALLRCVSVEP